GLFLPPPNSATACPEFGLLYVRRFLAQPVREIQKPCKFRRVGTCPHIAPPKPAHLRERSPQVCCHHLHHRISPAQRPLLLHRPATNVPIQQKLAPSGGSPGSRRAAADL